MEKSKLNQRIGQRLKELRMKKGWSLEETAKQTGVSKPMLGQMERGESNPTVGTLWKIASGMNVAFTSFVEEPRPAVTFVRYRDLETLDADHGGFHVKPVFLKESDRSFEFFYVEMDANGAYSSNAHQHGVEEYILVQKGMIVIDVEGTRYDLGEKDALHFQADRDHTYINLGKDKAMFMMAIYYTK